MLNAETISKQHRTATFRMAGAPRMQWTSRERKMELYRQNNCCDDSARLMDWVFLQGVNVVEGVRTLLFTDLPALKDCLRLYDPSIAASNERMVSNGRSRRGRVGLDLSGSTRSKTLFQPSSRVRRETPGRSIPMMFPSASRCSISRSEATETPCVTAMSAAYCQLELCWERKW